MSVINDVLKDLEARESQFTPIDIDSIEASPRVRRKMNPLLFTAMLLPLLAVAAWFYLQQQSVPAIVAPLSQAAQGSTRFLSSR